MATLLSTAIRQATPDVKPYPYSLDMLPVQGVGDIAQTIRGVRHRLLLTLKILDGVRKVPTGLPQELVLALDKIRFHVINGLSFVDTALRRGHSFREPHINAEGLRESIDLHVEAVQQALPLWNMWLADARASALPTESLPVPAPAVAGVGFGADAPVAPTDKGPSSAWLWIGAGALALLLLTSRSARVF